MFSPVYSPFLVPCSSFLITCHWFLVPFQTSKSLCVFTCVFAVPRPSFPVPCHSSLVTGHWSLLHFNIFKFLYITHLFHLPVSQPAPRKSGTFYLRYGFGRQAVGRRSAFSILPIPSLVYLSLVTSLSSHFLFMRNLPAIRMLCLNSSNNSMTSGINFRIASGIYSCAI